MATKRSWDITDINMQIRALKDPEETYDTDLIVEILAWAKERVIAQRELSRNQRERTKQLLKLGKQYEAQLQK